MFVVLMVVYYNKKIVVFYVRQRLTYSHAQVSVYSTTTVGANINISWRGGVDFIGEWGGFLVSV